jgi:hypothetical protein
MEIHEQALLAVLSEHLAVTTRLLEHYISLVRAVRVDQEISSSLPPLEQHPTLQELHASTLVLQLRVQSILEKK